MAQWAGRHGLALTESGLLPPDTPVLRSGRGLGTQRAHILDEAAPHGLKSITPTNDRRPERATANLCAGVLSGGLAGTLAHHTHLIEEPRTGVNRWLAVTDTVVVVRIPEATRVVCRLTARDALPAPSAAAAISMRDPSGDPATTIVAHPVTEEVRDGLRWRLDPAEGPGTLDAIAGPDTLAALRAAPPGTRIEVDFGVLCVALTRTVDDACQLDALCRVAAAVARGIRAAAARSERPRPTRRWPRARPWGMEAFAREYAKARGLRLEEVDAFRHRFDAPLPGRPIKAFHGDLGNGVCGHLAIWQDPTDPDRQRHWLLAVVRTPSALPPVAPPYVAEIRSGALVIAREVSASERSLPALDALAAVARRADPQGRGPGSTLRRGPAGAGIVAA